MSRRHIVWQFFKDVEINVNIYTPSFFAAITPYQRSLFTMFDRKCCYL